MAKTSQRPDDEPRLTTKELAARERVSLLTVYQWNSRGGGPPRIKTGRQALYRLSDVIAWEESRLVASGENAPTA